MMPTPPGPERLPSPYGIPLTVTTNQLDTEEGEVIEATARPRDRATR